MSAADATARIVALHHTVGTASRRRAVPSARPPTLIEADYARVLVGMVNEWRDAMQPLLDALPQLIADARRHRTDDTSDGRRAKQLTDRARILVSRQGEQAPYIAQRYAEQVVRHGAAEFSRQSKAALGVELKTLDRAVPTRIGHFAHENAVKITRLGDDTLGKVAQIVAEGFTNDESIEEIAAEIQERFNVAETYARQLARDQITKLSTQVARMRYQEVGITVFRWSTRRDPLVRPSHAVKEGKLFPYEGSRAPSFFPGDEYGCRCEEVPVFDEISNKALALAGKGRRRVA